MLFFLVMLCKCFNRRESSSSDYSSPIKDGGAKEGRYSGPCDEQLLSPLERHLHRSMAVVMPHSVHVTRKV